MSTSKKSKKTNSLELQLGKVLFARQVTGDIFNALNDLSTLISQDANVSESEAFLNLPHLLENLTERIENLDLE